MAAILIPARWASTRFPGKPLALLKGRPLIQHVWERACTARSARRVIIATDDMRIAETAFAFGAEVALTSRRHPSGTDRIAEVAAKLRSESIMINVQGDEPLFDPRLIDRLAEFLRGHPRVPMATAAAPLHEESAFHDPHIVKAVVAPDGRALYFSRAPVPASREGKAPRNAFHHIGIYAYRRTFLLKFVAWKPTPLEKLEKLEQLRALENGATIHVIPTSKTRPGIDTPAQLAALEKPCRG
jgi:3-deoxy-manno-octulosonate cytidylyltransferase (CMP-KDO synthetase)